MKSRKKPARNIRFGFTVIITFLYIILEGTVLVLDMHYTIFQFLTELSALAGVLFTVM